MVPKAIRVSPAAILALAFAAPAAAVSSVPPGSAAHGRSPFAAPVAAVSGAPPGGAAHTRLSFAARARAARSLPVRDEGRLSFVNDNATQIIDEGRVSGTIPGRARVDFAYNGSPTVSARFVIAAAGGSLYGHATCRLSNPTSPVPSFRGALAITGGSGRYRYAKGRGELFGVFHRRGYALVVQTIGRLTY